MEIKARIADLLYRYQKDIDQEAIDYEELDDDMEDLELLNAVLQQFDEETVEDDDLSFIEYKLFIEKH